MDGSCYVSSACQNPTLTMMALAARGCDYLVEEFRADRRRAFGARPGAGDGFSMPPGGCRLHYRDATIDRCWISLTIARRLTEASLDRDQADVMADAIRQAAGHGDHVTPDALRAELATLRVDIHRAMLVQMAATIAGTVAVLLLLG